MHQAARLNFTTQWKSSREQSHKTSSFVTTATNLVYTKIQYNQSKPTVRAFSRASNAESIFKTKPEPTLNNIFAAATRKPPAAGSSGIFAPPSSAAASVFAKPATIFSAIASKPSSLPVDSPFSKTVAKSIFAGADGQANLFKPVVATPVSAPPTAAPPLAAPVAMQVTASAVASGLKRDSGGR